MTESAFREILDKLAPLEATSLAAGSLTFSACNEVVQSNSGGFARAPELIAAAAAPTTKRVEYEHEGLRFFVASTIVRAQLSESVLVVLGAGKAGAPARELIGGFRLYPEAADDVHRLATEPGLALATLITRYGADYQVEGGRRSRFEPLVVFDRGRFVLHGSIQVEELIEALDVPTGINDAYTLVTSVRVTDTGQVKLLFPILLRTNDYAADIHAATQG